MVLGDKLAIGDQISEYERLVLTLPFDPVIASKGLALPINSVKR